MPQLASNLIVFVRLAICAACITIPCGADETEDTDVVSQPDATTIRIGTYDTRAIALAYAASQFNPVAKKMEEMKAAKAAGDESRIAELEAWGQKHQRQLHRQGFGRVPVDDLLAHVKEQLPAVAKEAGVVAITAQLDFAGVNVQAVDVTGALVALYDPPEKTLQWIQQLKDKEPIDLDELEKHEE